MDEIILVECVLCGDIHEVKKEFFKGYEHCSQCNDMTNHIEIDSQHNNEENG
jgi:hypothetical protein